jgi:hypothetical protein
MTTKSKLKGKKSGRVSPASPRRRRTLLIIAAVLVSAGILAAAVAFRGGESQQTSDAAFARLNGRWLRPDGGYVLEIRGAGAGGAIDVAYRNPQPINVARAEATRAESTVKVFIELRAPGYPGSTYTLTYDAQRDQLQGTYFQAALGQSFAVAFVRLNSSTR